VIYSIHAILYFSSTQELLTNSEVTIGGCYCASVPPSGIARGGWRGPTAPGSNQGGVTKVGKWGW